ncbi:MAG: glycosyltransferase family 2 protein [Brevinematia bacterium]
MFFRKVNSLPPCVDPCSNFDIPEVFRSKKISILMPFLNEEGKILESVNEVLNYFSSIGMSFEIVLVDDGSTDNSFQILQKNFKENPNIKLIKNISNFGKGWALKTAYEFSTGELVLFLDSDLELSPSHLPNFLRIMQSENADVVIGSKLHPYSIVNYPFYRRILSLGYYTVVKILFGLPIMDSQTGIKLFKREALEISLPKVLVKRFAFDIELLLILYKNKKKISSAPIKLDFSRKFGWNFKAGVIFKTFYDTLAIWYRDKVLRFYDRPFGENRKFFYSIVLFSEKNDEFEKNAFKKFQSLLYPFYEVILIGSEKFQSDRDYKFIYAENGKSEVEKFLLLSESGVAKGEVFVFSRLNSFPDERFLYNAGRILSLDKVGSIGGYLVPPRESTPFEKISYRLLGSFFLNFNLVFRYKPINFKKVKELHLNGLFIKREIVKIQRNYRNEKRLEHLLSEVVATSEKEMYYSPDIMLYQRFPETFSQLVEYVRQNSISRAKELKEIISTRRLKNLSFSFIIPFILSGFLISAFISLNKLLLSILAFYYLILILSRIILYGIIDGIFYSFLISFLQLTYTFFYLIEFVSFRRK